MKAIIGVAACFFVSCSGLVAVGQGQDVYHEGDITLTGTERMVIENVVYHQAGNIWLTDNSELVVRNATLIFEDAAALGPNVWGSIVWLSAGESATLRITDSAVLAVDPSDEFAMVRINAAGTSTVTLDSVTLSGPAYGLHSSSLTIVNSRVSELLVFDQASVSMQSSTVDWAVSLEFSGNTSGELASMQPGPITEWRFPGDFHVQNPTISVLIRDTVVGSGWSIRVGDATDLVIRDSSLVRMVLGLRNPGGTVRGIGPGDYQDWSVSGGSLQTELRLRLVNVSITDHWNLYVYDCWRDLTISECQFADVSFSNYSGTVHFDRTAIRAFQLSSLVATFEFTDCSLERGLDLDSTWVELKGSLNIAGTASFYEWDRSTARRAYGIRVSGPSGAPISHATVLVSQGARQVRELVTDARGEAVLEVDFSSDAQHEVWDIRATAPDGRMAETRIGFLTSSPVLLQVSGE